MKRCTHRSCAGVRGRRGSAVTQPVNGAEPTRTTGWHSRHDARHSKGRCQATYTRRVSLIRLNKIMLFLLLIIAMSSAVVSCDGNLTQQADQWEWRAPHMNRVLREAMAGPLRGRKVALLADDSLFKNLEGGSVLDAADTQTVTLSFPRHGEDNDTDLYRFIKPRKTLPPQRTGTQGMAGRICVSPSVHVPSCVCHCGASCPTPSLTRPISSSPMI